MTDRARRTRLLFVCSANLNRSRTAEDLFHEHPRYEARSCGVLPEAVRVCSGDLIRWADIIICMEDWHRQFLATSFPEMAGKRVLVLNIPDQYFRGDPHLVLRLRHELARVLDDFT